MRADPALPWAAGSFIDECHVRRVAACSPPSTRPTPRRNGPGARCRRRNSPPLATWNYEIFSNWAFNPATNATFVTEQRFPPVPGMVALADQAATRGNAVFFLTGRPAGQEAATLSNLTSDGVGEDAGYPAPATLSNGEDGLFTKPAVAEYPDYLQTACAAEISAGTSCTTVHYKSATRAHIESLGYEIVAIFGDQFSDLVGGFANRTFKLPNPNYFLP